MEKIVLFLQKWLGFLFDAIFSTVGKGVSLFDWPAQATGIPSEVLAAALVLGILIVLWRALGGYIT